MPRQLKESSSKITDAPKMLDTLSRHVECSICMAVCHNAASCTPCLHTFCIGCIAKWTEKDNGKCPMCRVSVKEVTPNWMVRDLVNTYLQHKPTQKRTEGEIEELDRAELEYTVKWLGDTDENLLYIESLGSLRGVPEEGDQRTALMLSRAMELFKQILGADEKQYPKELLKKSLIKLIEDVKKEVFPAVLFQKYHRLEMAYKRLVKISVPVIGPDEHSWLGNYYFNTAAYNEDPDDSDDDSFDIEEDEEFNLDLPGRIDDALTAIRHPERQKPARPTVGGFDPVILEALARVQNMHAPGFNRLRSRPMTARQLMNERARLELYAQVHQEEREEWEGRFRRREERRQSVRFAETQDLIPAEAPILTRRHGRRSEATTSSSENIASSVPPRPVRRSARLAAARLPE